jgi:hypothetical protein
MAIDFLVVPTGFVHARTPKSGPTASSGSRHVLTHDAWMARRNPQER